MTKRTRWLGLVVALATGCSAAGPGAGLRLTRRHAEDRHGLH